MKYTKMSIKFEHVKIGEEPSIELKFLKEKSFISFRKVNPYFDGSQELKKPRKG